MDPRLSFLARAAARWWLVENGEMELDEAFDGLVNDITERKAIEKHFEVVWRKDREERLKKWREHGASRMLLLRKTEGNKANKEGG